MARAWEPGGPNALAEIEWGGRTWEFVSDDDRPGLRVRGGSVGPLLALDAVVATGRADPAAFAGASVLRDGTTVRLSVRPEGWDGLTVRAAWSVAGEDGIDLEIEAALDAGTKALIGFEIRVGSVLPEPPGSRRRRWVEPRDATAAALGYDGREGDASDLTTLPAVGPDGLAPRILPSPWDDGLSYVEIPRPGEVARRVTEAGKISSLGHTTRYALFGHNVAPGETLQARLRGLWLLSSSPTSEALDRAEAFRRGD